MHLILSPALSLAFIHKVQLKRAITAIIPVGQTKICIKYFVTEQFKKFLVIIIGKNSDAKIFFRYKTGIVTKPSAPPVCFSNVCLPP